jgi:hypothetical protein
LLHPFIPRQRTADADPSHLGIIAKRPPGQPLSDGVAPPLLRCRTGSHSSLTTGRGPMLDRVPYDAYVNELFAQSGAPPTSLGAAAPPGRAIHHHPPCRRLRQPRPPIPRRVKLGTNVHKLAT